MKNNQNLDASSAPLSPPSSVNVVETNVENINTVVIEKKKRGRKKIIKPESIESNLTTNEFATQEENIKVNENKKERKQRMTKIQKENIKNIKDEGENLNAYSDNNENLTPYSSTTNIIVHKKRGRKPRGGKIIHENPIEYNNSPEVPNIILHLKCVLSDLKKSNEMHSNKVDEYATDTKNSILCYNDDDQSSIFFSNKSSVTNYESCDKNECHKKTNEAVYDPSSFYSKNPHHPHFNVIDLNVGPQSENKININRMHDCTSVGLEESNSITNKEIWKKISQLKLNFHKNDSLSIQRSACFWDTCEFDTPPIHIPMSSTKGYGCFCHPQCAVAFLMNENIDTSVKFERYYLLNSIYGPIYNYSKSIKPAASPHYLLNKFYGNLTIHEYRKLFHSEQVVYIVNKPLTNVLPELYEDNNDFFVGNKIIQSNATELKNKNKTAKSSIINEVFGVK
jgi:hypothetical protein